MSGSSETLPAVVGKESSTSVEHEMRLAEALEQLRLSQAGLLQARELQAIGQLATGIAQEVNTPAQYVTDNVSFLQRAFDKLLKLIDAQSNLVEAARSGEVTPLALEAADAARRAVKLDYLMRQVPRAIEQSMQGLGQISSIVKAIKEFSNPSGPAKQPFDLHELIESTTIVARNEWRYVAELELVFDWSLPPILLLRNEFSQVMLDLIVNAAHAIATALPPGAADKGKIIISTKAVGDCVEVRVSDDGARIPPELRARLFEPVVSTKAAESREVRGLAIARAVIVDKHGGSLDFEADAEQGTIFIIRLPLAAP